MARNTLPCKRITAYHYGRRKTTTLQLTNLSDFAFEFAESENPEKVTLLPARSSVILKVPRTESGTAYQVRNLLPGPGEPVTIKLPLN